MSCSHPARWNFDIDQWLNPIVPRPPWQRLPTLISHFLGYRKETPKPIGNLLIAGWALVGVFLGLIVIELVTKQVAVFHEHQAPIIIASFGAGAVLHFYSIESPLAQPRNAVLGQVISSIVGVGICKLFAMSPNFESIRWLGGALACAIATALMAFTKTVHPPAGATALLAVVSNDALPLGWLLVPMIFLGAVLMLIVALFINNIQRKFPQYWWTPDDLSPGKGRDGTNESKSSIGSDADLEKDLNLSSTSQGEGPTDQVQLIIKKGSVIVPSFVFLTPEERAYLEELSNRL